MARCAPPTQNVVAQPRLRRVRPVARKHLPGGVVNVRFGNRAADFLRHAASLGVVNVSGGHRVVRRARGAGHVLLRVPSIAAIAVVDHIAGRVVLVAVVRDVIGRGTEAILRLGTGTGGDILLLAIAVLIVNVAETLRVGAVRTVRCAGTRDQAVQRVVMPVTPIAVRGVVGGDDVAEWRRCVGFKTVRPFADEGSATRKFKGAATRQVYSEEGADGIIQSAHPEIQRLRHPPLI